MDDTESISSLLSFPSPPLVYLSAGITSTFGKLRRAPIDEAACRTFSTLDACTCTRGGSAPLLRQVLWTVDVGQEFVIPASVSFVSVWGISAIFSAKDNCRGDGIPSRKKSRVTSYTISSRVSNPTISRHAKKFCRDLHLANSFYCILLL